MTGFKCLATGETFPADYPEFQSPAGANLEVLYDYESLKGTVLSSFHSAARPDIFKYLALLPLESDALAPPLRVGPTPLYRADRLGASAGLNHLLVKDDGLNPSGSFKDRASAVALAKARELGADVVAGASTGNAGSSMACMAASVGMPCVIFVPEKAPPAKIAQLLVFGARVIAVRGTYDDAFDLCQAICEARGWFNRNTGYNPYTREGKKTAAFELCEQLEWEAPDRIMVCVGDGNIISGVWKGFRELKAVGLIDRLPKIDCCQSAQSDAVSKTIHAVRASNPSADAIDWSTVELASVQATTIADSISVDVPRDGLAAVRAVMETGGEAITVDDSEIPPALLDVARYTGVFVEPSAAAVWACAKKAAGEGRISPDEKIVCLFTGNGLKDVDRARQAAGEPAVVDADVDAAQKVLDEILD